MAWYQGQYTLPRRRAQHGLGNCRWLPGLLLCGLAVGLGPSPGQAQTTAQMTSPLARGRLTVRPHSMTTGSRNAHAGVQTLDSLPGYLVYVCESCVGTRRVPLVVVVHGGGGNARAEVEAGRRFADKYGMILLAPDHLDPDVGDHDQGRPGLPDAEYEESARRAAIRNVRRIDDAMHQVLRTYAIDPDRIAVIGGSMGGGIAVALGRGNMDIFSRVAGMSSIMVQDGYTYPGPQHTPTQFFLSAGLWEWAGMMHRMLKIGTELQHAGHPVQEVIGAGHTLMPNLYGYVWRWLNDSWSGSPRAMPRITADSLVLLDNEAITRMTTFWTSVTHEPDAIQTALQRRTDVSVPVEQSQAAYILMHRIVELAAQYPALASDLAKAGLTAPQAEAYEVALVSAEATAVVEKREHEVLAGSKVAKNLAFLQANESAVNALLDLMTVPRCGAPGDGFVMSADMCASEGP